MRKISLLDALDSTTHHDFPMRCEVIYISIFESFDLVFLVLRWIWLSIHDTHSRSIGKVTICMRYIIALEDDFSLLRITIAKSVEYMYHMITSESLILESSKLSLIGILSKLGKGEIKEVIFGSYLRVFERDPLLSEIFEKCSIGYILTNEEKVRKILGIEVLSHEKLHKDIFIEPTGYLMAKYSDDLTRSDLSKCNVYFIILFILTVIVVLL